MVANVLEVDPGRNGGASQLVASAVKRIRKAYPGLRVTIEVATSGQLAAHVQGGRLDFAIARLPAGMDPAAFDYEPIGMEELCFVARCGLPLTALRRVGIAGLEGQSWVLQLRGTRLRRSVNRLFQNANRRPPEQVVESASFDVSLAIVAQSDVLTVVSCAVAELYCPSRRFTVLRFAQPFSLTAYGFLADVATVYPPARQF